MADNNNKKSTGSAGGQAMRGSGGRRGRMMGPRPKLDHPWKLFGRIMGYIMKRYKFQFLLVLACIVVSVLANLQGTLFTRTLIDSYIMPMLGSSDPDFGPLAGAILKVAAFYAAGVLASFAQGMIMMDTSLMNLYNQKKITKETVLAACNNYDTVSLRLR